MRLQEQIRYNEQDSEVVVYYLTSNNKLHISNNLCNSLSTLLRSLTCETDEEEEEEVEDEVSVALLCLYNCNSDG